MLHKSFFWVVISQCMVLIRRQKMDDGHAQPFTQQVQTNTDQAESEDDTFKPTLHFDDARYLRKRKVHMDSMFESAADS